MIYEAIAAEVEPKANSPLPTNILSNLMSRLSNLA